MSTIAYICNHPLMIVTSQGVDVKSTKIEIFADVIESQLGIPCSALSGANIADEVANEAFSETTIGCRDLEDGGKWYSLFNTHNFRVSITDDVRGVSLCGALKNGQYLSCSLLVESSSSRVTDENGCTVVAVAAGFVDGLKWGNNSKAAIMRIGLLEMKKFSMEFFPGVRPETFVQEVSPLHLTWRIDIDERLQSAGIADLITSCLGGRNRKVAEAFVTANKVRPLLLSPPLVSTDSNLDSPSMCSRRSC